MRLKMTSKDVYYKLFVVKEPWEQIQESANICSSSVEINGNQWLTGKKYIKTF